MRAHSLYQYNKWKAWGRGEIKLNDMLILAETYCYEIHSMLYGIGKNEKELSDEEIFNMVSERIIAPEE